MRQVEGVKEGKEGLGRRGGRRKGERRDADPPYFTLCGDWQVLPTISLQTGSLYVECQSLCRMTICV